MAFKQMMPAQGKWRKLDGSNLMPKIVQSIAFIDGIKQFNFAGAISEWFLADTRSMRAL